MARGRTMTFSDAKAKAWLARANAAWAGLKSNEAAVARAASAEQAAKAEYARAKRGKDGAAARRAKAKWVKANRYWDRLIKEHQRKFKKADKIQKQANWYWHHAKRPPLVTGMKRKR